MKKKDHISVFQEYNHKDELEEKDKELYEKAGKILNRAYAPYSGFRVGCVVRLQSGKFISGTNQENAAFPSGMCAERVAVWNAGSNHPDDPIVSIAINGGNEQSEKLSAVSPCGGCRQVLAELEEKSNSKIPILFPGANGKVIKVNSVEALLPLMFKSADLNKGI
ncbi:MAG: cytidine deaminase [Flavobacteriales bacterium]